MKIHDLYFESECENERSINLENKIQLWIKVTKDSKTSIVIRGTKIVEILSDFLKKQFKKYFTENLKKIKANGKICWMFFHIYIVFFSPERNVVYSNNYQNIPHFFSILYRNNDIFLYIL